MNPEASLLLRLVHDLNNIISPISIAVQYISTARDIVSDEPNDLLKVAERDIERAMAQVAVLTRQLHAAANLASGTLHVELNPLDVGQYIERHIHRFVSEAARASCPVVIIPCESDTWAVSDIDYLPLALEYVVKHLHLLASKRRGNQMLVLVESGAQTVTISCIAQGCEVDPSELVTLSKECAEGLTADLRAGTLGWGWAASLARAFHGNLSVHIDHLDTLKPGSTVRRDIQLCLTLPRTFGDVITPRLNLLPAPAEAA